MPAIYPVFERPLPDADNFSGNFLSRWLRNLDETASSIDLTPLSRFIDSNTMASEVLDDEQIADIAVPLPDFDRRGEDLMRERSAVYWPEKINVPLLIMQGGADWRSDVSSQALAFAQKLQELNKTYELIIYANDDHGVSLNREDADRRIIEWFRRYMK